MLTACDAFTLLRLFLLKHSHDQHNSCSALPPSHPCSLCHPVQDYHTVLFGQTRGSIPSLPVSHALCLPVSLGEVLDSLQPQEHAVGGVKYNVVDSRPISHYSKGHLPSSLHLDATLVGVAKGVALGMK